MFFLDRRDAGRQLAGLLVPLRGTDTIVVAVARGGVPVAAQVAAAIDAPLEVCLVRTLRVASRPEVVIGAIGEDGVRVSPERVAGAAGVTDQDIADAEVRERAALNAMARAYRVNGQRLEVARRTVALVDDGLATGLTARAACRVVRGWGAARIILALPVAAYDKTAHLNDVADELVCVLSPRGFASIGRSYVRFPRVTDAQVIEELERAAKRPFREQTPEGGSERQHVREPKHARLGRHGT